MEIVLAIVLGFIFYMSICGLVAREYPLTVWQHLCVMVLRITSHLAAAVIIILGTIYLLDCFYSLFF